jgi:glycosyltransferase involved in cell wall biosynthesis
VSAITPQLGAKMGSSREPHEQTPATTKVLRGKRLLFVVNVDWFFLSHRLPLARAAQSLGMRVTVVAADTGRADAIRREGLEFVPLRLSRGGRNLLSEAAAIIQLASLYRSLRPAIVHQVTVKPVLYGTLAAYLSGRPAVVNAISGFGYVFSEDNSEGMLRRAVERLYRIALHYPSSRTIFQNPEDCDLFISTGLVRRGQAILIRGAGVDCSRYVPREETPGLPIVVMPARMIRDKGVVEFVGAARQLRGRGVAARFVLVGPLDPDNPGAVPGALIEQWVAEGVVEWWGHREDMPGVLSGAAVVALPTYYREGLPKVLLEAAACGRPLVATDIPGCREVVRNGETGLLIPPRDTDALAEALQTLLGDAALRATYGKAARELALREFTDSRIAEQTVALYGDLLSGNQAATSARP